MTPRLEFGHSFAPGGKPEACLTWGKPPACQAQGMALRYSRYDRV